MNDKERIKEILLKVKKTVGENNYKLALAIAGHRPGKIRDVSMSSKDGELLLDYITNLQQENARLKDKIKDLEEWLEAMASMYENEYKDVNASEHYKCMLHKLKEN